MSLKNPVTPAGIEPATFRFVAQHLNHCATAVLIPGATQMPFVCCRSDSDEQPMWPSWMYRSADKSLALSGWKQANVHVVDVQEC